ncbi:sorting nexin lst-4 isoform X2 [Anopheles merus]|uniref:Sorting nexin n=3 Tax=gambiae species complex TaxID=44542 RepID=A0A182UTP8_ANOME|nr:sorting nexin lst-4 isoform X2 [Anopheles merus]XP_041782621.1 sorting nexin lst-4 isoform X2 [Anopheles merus]
MTRVKVLYDFNGEPNSSEISISVDEVLTVTNTDVGEGWWEGMNSRGQRGLFPAAYVETIPEAPSLPSGPPKMPPPPAVMAQAATGVSKSGSQQALGNRYDQTSDDWGEQQDDWDDDWDDDNDTYSEIGPAAAATGRTNGQTQSYQQQHQHQQQQQQQQYHQQSATASYYANANLPAPPPGDGDTMSLASVATTVGGGRSRAAGTGKIFTKSGDNYLMGMPVPDVSESDRVHVLLMEQGAIVWKPMRDSYSVTVDSPKKEKKFNGLKSFIAYQLTPSFNNIPVARRYKHFDWLHERLVEKFCLIPIPPLPDKQISGRYDEEFVEHRRVQLQEFVDWMCRHPVLSTCGVWMHFLTCTDEKKWKTGKRTAEKDPLVGTMFCASVFPPEKTLLQSLVEPQVDAATQFVPQMDTAVKTLFAICGDQSKKFQQQWKKEYQRIGEGFSEMARALAVDERRAATQISLASSVGQAAGVFINIGQLFGEQPKHDFIPFSDRLHIYRGLLAAWPDTLGEYRNAVQKRKECERLTAEQKMENGQLQEVNRRVDVMSYALLAEMSHFREERDTHLKDTIRNFIGAQIDFYKSIVQKLEQAQTHF